MHGFCENIKTMVRKDWLKRYSTTLTITQNTNELVLRGQSRCKGDWYKLGRNKKPEKVLGRKLKERIKKKTGEERQYGQKKEENDVGNEWRMERREESNYVSCFTWSLTGQNREEEEHLIEGRKEGLIIRVGQRAVGLFTSSYIIF